MGPAAQATERSEAQGSAVGSTGLARAIARIEGFRLVVVDTGPAFAGIGSDELAPVLPSVRGSPAALLVVSEDRGRRVAIPTCTFERVSWERRFERTVGWTFEVGGPRGHSPLDKRALFAVPALGAAATDLGRRAGLAEAAAS